MADEIYLKTGELSSTLLRKAISKAENAQKKAGAAGDEAHWGHSWSWGGNTYQLFSTNAESLIWSADSKLEDVLGKLEKLAAILDSGPDEMEEIDRKYKSDLKSWRKSGNHGDLLWIVGGGSTAGATAIEVSRRNSRTETVINSYSDGVKKGEFRWVDQTGTQENKQANGWGHNSYCAGWQCNSACESMALSYMGIDKSPESMVPEYDDIGGLEVASYGTANKEWTAPDGSTILTENHSYCDMADIDNRVEKFSQDGNRGDTGPVMIRYEYPNGNGGHWLLITGKNPDGSYNVIGPATTSERGTTVTIDEYGNISGQGISQGGGRVHRYAQYSRVN